MRTKVRSILHNLCGKNYSVEILIGGNGTHNTRYDTEDDDDYAHVDGVERDWILFSFYLWHIANRFELCAWESSRTTCSCRKIPQIESTSIDDSRRQNSVLIIFIRHHHCLTMEPSSFVIEGERKRERRGGEGKKECACAVLLSTIQKPFHFRQHYFIFIRTVFALIH